MKKCLVQSSYIWRVSGETIGLMNSVEQEIKLVPFIDIWLRNEGIAGIPFIVIVLGIPDIIIGMPGFAFVIPGIVIVIPSKYKIE